MNHLSPLFDEISCKLVKISLEIRLLETKEHHPQRKKIYTDCLRSLVSFSTRVQAILTRRNQQFNHFIDFTCLINNGLRVFCDSFFEAQYPRVFQTLSTDLQNFDDRLNTILVECCDQLGPHVQLSDLVIHLRQKPCIMSQQYNTVLEQKLKILSSFLDEKLKYLCEAKKIDSTVNQSWPINFRKI